MGKFRIIAATILTSMVLAAISQPSYATDDSPASDAPESVGVVSITEDLTESGTTTLRHERDGHTVTTSSAQVVGDDHAGDAVNPATKVTVDTGRPNQTVLANITAVGSRTAGFTTVWRCGEQMPLASVNNYVAGQLATPNFVAVKADAKGIVCLYSSGDAEILWDQYGSTDKWATTTPTREFDTRERAANPTRAKVSPSNVWRLRTGKPGQTVLGNLTVTEPEVGGFTTVYPCAQGRPNASINNFVAGQTTPNFLAVPTDAAGELCFYSSVPAHLIFDSVAAVPSNTMAAGAAQRLLDTRTNPDRAAIPSGGVARVATGNPNATVFGNLTVTEPTRSGFTTLWNCDSPRPLASVNNFEPGQTTPNFAAVRTNAQGEFCIYTSSTAHLIWDQTGHADMTIEIPTRLLDTRQWGAGIGANDGEHWSAMSSGSNRADAIRWDSCTAAINVYINPAGSGSRETASIIAALNKIRTATGLPVIYAGTTSVTPTVANNYGYGQLPGNSVVVAFASGQQRRDAMGTALGIGGYYYNWGAGHRYLASYGFVMINDDDLPEFQSAVAHSVYMHEFGHVFGLGHYQDRNQVMNPTISRIDGLWGRGDQHGLAAMGKATGPACS